MSRSVKVYSFWKLVVKAVVMVSKDSNRRYRGRVIESNEPVVSD